MNLCKLGIQKPLWSWLGVDLLEKYSSAIQSRLIAVIAFSYCVKCLIGYIRNKWIMTSLLLRSVALLELE
jgi:hypothetical protein